jgi:Big-like domain-containing protein/hemolysin type calcium-binding protein
MAAARIRRAQGPCRGTCRGLVTVVSVVLVAAVGAGPAAAQGVLDQSQVASDGVAYIAPDSGDSLPNYAAQTFIPAVTGSIDRIDLLVSRESFSSDEGHDNQLNVVLSKWTWIEEPVASGTTVALARLSIPSSEIPSGPNPEWISARFDPPVPVTAGNRYGIELDVPDASSTMFGLAVANRDPYPQGSMWTHSWHNWQWRSHQNTDLAFKTYVIPSPRPTSSLVFDLGTCTPGGIDWVSCPTSSLVGSGLMPGATILFCERGPDYTSDVCHATDGVEQDGTPPDRFASFRFDCEIGWVFTYVTTTAAGTSIAASDTCEAVAAAAPRAVGNTYTVDLGASLVVSAPGVLRNDSDPNGDVLRAVLVSGPTHGRLTLNANGSLRYTPSEDFIGLDSFRYKASDGSRQSAAATVRIKVRAACGGQAATKVGTGAANTITGTAGADVIVGLGGNDAIRGLAGNDRVCGGSGADSISGGAGDDVLIGGSGKDVLRGDVGNDRLFGGAGADTLFGDAGADRLDGGANSPDRCQGGPGSDTVTASCERST